MEQEMKVREVMRPPKGDNITLEQAKRVFLEIMREEEEARERKNAERLARRRAKRAEEAKP